MQEWRPWGQTWGPFYSCCGYEYWCEGRISKLSSSHSITCPVNLIPVSAKNWRYCLSHSHHLNPLSLFEHTHTHTHIRTEQLLNSIAVQYPATDEKNATGDTTAVTILFFLWFLWCQCAEKKARKGGKDIERRERMTEKGREEKFVGRVTYWQYPMFQERVTLSYANTETEEGNERQMEGGRDTWRPRGNNIRGLVTLVSWRMVVFEIVVTVYTNDFDDV